MPTKHHNRGFTFTELLVVMFVIVVLATFSVVSFKNINIRQALRVTSQDVYGALIDARSDTLASEGDTVYGVHFDTNQIVRFSGASYSSTSPDNVTITFVDPVSATTSLTGSATEIVFTRLTGTASATGTITLTNNGDSTTTISVHQSGLVETDI